MATVSRQATSCGQARQTLTRALSSANEAADAANRATSASVVATGVLEVAGSSGQPLPASVVYYAVPQPVLVQIGPPPSGYRYVRVANDILLMAVGSRMVIDAITDLGRVL